MCVRGCVCSGVFSTRRVCVSVCIYATSYTPGMADGRRKGRSIKTHDTSATTTAARASATNAGARAYNDDAFLECHSLSLSPPSPTHNPPTSRWHTHTARIGVSSRMNLPLCCLCPAPSLLSGVFVSECTHA